MSTDPKRTGEPRPAGTPAYDDPRSIEEAGEVGTPSQKEVSRKRLKEGEVAAQATSGGLNLGLDEDEREGDVKDANERMSGDKGTRGPDRVNPVEASRLDPDHERGTYAETGAEQRGERASDGSETDDALRRAAKR